MGDFRKKRILQTDFEGKNYCKEITGKKIPTLKKYISRRTMLGKKSYTVACQEKILLPEV